MSLDFVSESQTQDTRTSDKNCGLAIVHKGLRGKPAEYYCGDSPLVTSPDGVGKKLMAQMWAGEECVATDDPGLKRE